MAELHKYLKATGLRMVLIVVVLLLLTSATQAATYYVDNVNGNDIINDGSLTNPWASIRKAMNNGEIVEQQGSPV